MQFPDFRPGLFHNPVAFSEANNVNYPPAKPTPFRLPFGHSLPRAETNIPFQLAVEVVKDKLSVSKFFNSDPALILYVDDNDTALPFDLAPSLPVTKVSASEFEADLARVVILGRPLFDTPEKRQRFVSKVEHFVERGGTLISIGCHHILPAFPGTIEIHKRHTAASSLTVVESQLAGLETGSEVDLHWQREISIVGDAITLASASNGLPLAVQFQWRRGIVYYFVGGLFLKVSLRLLS